MKRLIYILFILSLAQCLSAGVLPPRRLFDAERRFGDIRPKPDLTPNKASLRSGERLGEGSAKSPGWQPNGICLCDTSGNFLPHIVSDGNSGAIISWSEAYRGWPIDTTRSLRDIYAQRVDSGGNIVWQSQGVPVCSLYATDAAYEKIVSDGKGGAIIAWEEIGRPPDGYSHVWAQRLDSMGNRLWPENGVLVCSQSSGYVDICSDGHAGAIIAWVDGRNEATTSDDIYAQRIDSAGNPVWQLDGVPVCTADSIQSWPAIVEDGRDGAIVTWQDYRNGNYDIYAQHIGSNGNLTWIINGVQTHAPTLQHERYPRLIQNNKGGAIVCWIDYGNGKTLAQSLDSLGVKLWNNVGINTLGTYGDLSPINIDGGLSNSYAVQCVDSLGILKWGNGVLLHGDTTGGQFGSVSDTFGNLFVVWDELRNNPNYDDQYAQKVNINGIVKWGDRGVAVCTLQTGYETYPQIASDGLGGAICTWFGDPNHSWNHVWVQRIYPDGDGVNGNPVQSIEYKISNLKCCPNPYRTRVGISYDLLSDDYVSLYIYNMLGQQVKTLVRQKQSSGRHEIKWHGDDDTGESVSAGIYFVAITYGRFVKSQKLIKLK